MTARGELTNNGVVRLRRGGGRNKGELVGQFTLPKMYAKHVPFGSRFHVEPVEEGFLFRYVGPPESVDDVPANLPDWMTNQ